MNWVPPAKSPASRTLVTEDPERKHVRTRRKRKTPMISALQWFVLAVCALITFLRMPAALRGENRSLFGIFLLVTVGMVLSIQWSYTLIDGFLGSHNYANLALRYVVYGTVLLAGYKIVKGFENTHSLRLLLGPVGLAALATICLATAVPFLMANTAGTSVG